jgi:hypothetical protein
VQPWLAGPELDPLQAWEPVQLSRGPLPQVWLQGLRRVLELRQQRS